MIKITKKTVHKSKDLDKWNSIAQEHDDWYNHHLADIYVDSSEWGENQCYMVGEHYFNYSDQWLDSKVKELQAIKHIYRATITLFRKLWVYNPKLHMYSPKRIRYMTIYIN